MSDEHLIVAWNRERGLLDNFDINFELKMLSEEAREFFTATSFAHRLCEYSDFLFVKEGTFAKYYARVSDFEGISESLLFKEAAFSTLRDWVYDVQTNMFQLLRSEYMRSGYSIDFHDLLDLAMEVVIKNNNLKGKKKENGKIVKAEDQPKPEVILERLINESL